MYVCMFFFSGGMPRASYSDKYTVTVQQGDKHVAFDFTSRVSYFQIIKNKSNIFHILIKKWVLIYQNKANLQKVPLSRLFE